MVAVSTWQLTPCHKFVLTSLMLNADACTSQLGLVEEEMHSAVEGATAAADDDLNDVDDTEEVEKIIQTATATGKSLFAVC